MLDSASKAFFHLVAQSTTLKKLASRYGMRGGASFARRFIEIGGREGGRVGVRAGVTSGERVVTRGAYDVQLASAAKGLPAEGHVH